MTRYTTNGKKVYPDFYLPLFYSKNLFLAEHQPDLYQLIFLEAGELILKDAEHTGHYLAPLILTINDKNNIKEIQSRNSKCHNFIFTPDALNNNYYNNLPSAMDTALFFLRPFHEIREKGHKCRPLPSEYSLKFSLLCEKMDLYLNEQTVPDNWPCLSRSYFLEILMLLERSYYLSAENKEICIPETGTKIDRIFIYLHTHYNERINLDGLCRSFATNRTTLNKLFQDICGMSVIAYLNHLRMDVAASLLQNTQIPLTEVADRIGIDDLSYFGRAFKKRTRFSPSEFRKNIPSPYAVGQ
jgi:AraC-like DNA-binding protein